MSKFALVSTVDTLPEGFPSHCVMLFESEEDAIKHAVDLIVAYDATVSVGNGSLGGWSIDDEHWDHAKDFFEAWHDGLDITEYFHIMPVLPVQVPQKAVS